MSRDYRSFSYADACEFDGKAPICDSSFSIRRKVILVLIGTSFLLSSCQEKPTALLKNPTAKTSQVAKQKTQTIENAIVQELESDKCDKVETLLIKASEEATETANKDLILAAEIYSQLGDLNLIQGKYEKAADYYLEAADLVPDGSGLVKAKYLEKMGTSLCKLGDIERARKALINSLEIKESFLGIDHPDSKRIKMSLSSICND